MNINEKNTINKKTPSLAHAKSRGKNAVQYGYDFAIPEDYKEMGNNRSFFIRTYGCQMNEHDTEVLTGIFQKLGFKKAEFLEEADVILLNTCAIRENAENKVFGEIGHLKFLKRQKPSLLIGVCGCMAQEEVVVLQILKKHPHVDFVFGTHNIHRLPEILHEAYFSKEMVVEVWSEEGDIVERLPKERNDKVRAWVNIMYGCDKFCTYCIVPFTRGKERSRLPEDIIAEINELIAEGYQEITLLGQNINAYGKDFVDRKFLFSDLLAECNKLKIARLRFMTSHPRDFDDKLIEVLSKKGNLMESIHLPVQSGSTAVLKKMGRKYTREQFLTLVKKIKTAMPDVTLTTDIIVGFPNETDEQFAETLSLYEEVEFDMAYTFIYSKRSGTAAANIEDNIPLETKKKRLQQLNGVVNKIALKKNQKLVGQVVEVLVEKKSQKNSEAMSGHTRTNKLINFCAPKTSIGKIINVKVVAGKTWSLDGELIE